MTDIISFPTAISGIVTPSPTRLCGVDANLRNTTIVYLQLFNVQEVPPDNAIPLISLRLINGRGTIGQDLFGTEGLLFKNGLVFAYSSDLNVLVIQTVSSAIFHTCFYVK